MSWIGNSLLVLVSIALPIVIAESALRALFPYHVSEVDIRDHSNPLMPKHMAGSHENKIRGTVATFDRNGLRLDSESCSTSDNAENVLLVGDSNIAGFFLDDSEALGAQLTKLSKSTDTCYEVDAFGVSGFGPDQTFFAISALTERKKYDAVIFHIFADNDLGDLIRNNNYRNGNLYQEGYCYITKPFFEDFLLYKALRSAVFKVTGIAMGFGQPRSSILGAKNCLSWPNSSDGMFDLAERDKVEFENGFTRIYMGYDRYDVEFACKTDLKMSMYAHSAMTHISNELSLISDKKGFNVIYLIQPSEVDVTKHNPDISGALRSCDLYNSQNLTDFFGEVLKDRNVINLFKSFEGCDACYFSESELIRDNHWSPYGVNRAAEIIVSSGLL